MIHPKLESMSDLTIPSVSISVTDNFTLVRGQDYIQEELKFGLIVSLKEGSQAELPDAHNIVYFSIVQ